MEEGTSGNTWVSLGGKWVYEYTRSREAKTIRYGGVRGKVERKRCEEKQLALRDVIETYFSGNLNIRRRSW